MQYQNHLPPIGKYFYLLQYHNNNFRLENKFPYTFNKVDALKEINQFDIIKRSYNLLPKSNQQMNLISNSRSKKSNGISFTNLHSNEPILNHNELLRFNTIDIQAFERALERNKSEFRGSHSKKRGYEL